MPPTNDVPDSTANAWMFENESQSQTSRSYGSSSSFYNYRSEIYSESRRKIPIKSSTNGISSISRCGVSSQGSQHHGINEMQTNPNIKQEEEIDTPSSNYISDKPRMSLRERYTIHVNRYCCIGRRLHK